LSPRGLDSAEQKAEIKLGALTLICSTPYPWHLAINMKADLQEVIDFGNAPMAEREELAGDVTEIMDALFEAMKKLPDE
jgi:hypothetical protein